MITSMLTLFKNANTQILQVGIHFQGFLTAKFNKPDLFFDANNEFS